MERQSLQSETEGSQKSHQGQSEEDKDEDFVDRQTRSRVTTKRGEEEKVWTTDEILADEELWRVTDSSEDESDEDAKEEEKRPAGGN